MANCTQLLPDLRSADQRKILATLERLARDPKLNDIARICAHRYPDIRPRTWRQLFDLAFEDFTVHVWRNGSESIKDCHAYFYTICKNICLRWVLEPHVVPIDEVELIFDDPQFEAVIAKVLEKMDPRQRALVQRRFLDNPPEKDPAKLAEAYNAAGGQILPGSVPSLLTRAKDAFKRILRNSDLLDHIF